MKFFIIRNESGLYSLKSEWEKIILSSDNFAITQTWEWMSTWWKIYGKSKNLFILCGYENNELTGILPLSTDKKPVSVKHFISKPHHMLGSGRTDQRGVVSDYLDFIIKKGWEEKFIRSLFTFLDHNTEWEEIILANIDATSNLFKLFVACLPGSSFSLSIEKTSPSPLIKLPDSWEIFLESISSSLRYKIRRGRKEFEKAGGSFRVVHHRKDLFQAFNNLEYLHQISWTSRGEPGAFADPGWRTFHKRLIPQAFSNNWLHLSFLDINGKPAAANYNFVFNKKVHFYQSGVKRHENKHIRLGLLLHSFCIQEAIEQKYLEYDFLSAGSSGAGYKEIWTDFHRELITIRLARNNKKERLYLSLSNAVNSARKIKQKITSSNRQLASKEA